MIRQGFRHWGWDFFFYGSFIISIFLKLYLFAAFSNTVFAQNGLPFFLKASIIKLFNEGSITGFYAGLTLISIGALLVLSFWTLFLKQSKRWISLLILNVVLTFIIVGDLIYYRYFNDLLSMTVLSQANQVGAISGSILDLFQMKDLVFVIDLLVLIPLVILVIKRGNGDLKARAVTRGALGLATLIIGYLFITSPINEYTKKYGSALFSSNWYNMALYSQTGLLGFHGFDIYRYVNESVFQQKKISAKESKEIENWFGDHQSEMNKETPLFGVAKDKNVIMIQLEAFQNFVINQKINGEEITPNINKLINDSMYFPNFSLQTGQGRTSDAEFLANASLHPLYSGSVYVRYPSNTYDSLPGILKQNGYETAAFHAYKKSFWNRYIMYDNYGFDHFFGEGDFKDGEIAGWTLGDKPFMQQSVDELMKMKKPFYGFMVALTSHHPYNIQSKFRTLDVGEYEGSIVGDYLHSVHYVDEAVGMLVDRLQKENLWDDTVLLLYGDHDYGVDNNDAMMKIAGEDNTPYNIEKTFHEVPLVIHLPNDEGKGIYERTGGQLDLAPTILHALGIPFKDRYMMGGNMLEDKNQLVVQRDLSFTNGEFTYKSSVDGFFDKGTCFDGKTGKITDITLCKPAYDQARKELNISDKVIFSNELERLMKKE
ncbi:LTA synthase family protein [Bacillus sp. E(2018)]|uniref:LTA synthase family protein n=1 Tax=Bacillus sp. E(2018) TaxID=2502239 RepID=UPI001485043D|nr:LTA synthase family protein [Bacillus sp. E(2018)]